MSEGFDVLEPVEVDLTDVKEERSLIPATRNVKLRINGAKPGSSKDNAYRSLNVDFRLVDGIDGKYKGKPIFTKICYYADPAVYTKDWFVKKQHLVQLQKLCKALGIERPVVNDEFIANIRNKVVLGNIIQKPNNFTASDGTEIHNIDNEVRDFKALPLEQQV